MKIEIQLTKQDVELFNVHIRKKAYSKATMLVTGFWGNMLLWFFIGLGGIFTFRILGYEVHWTSFFFAMLVFGFIYLQNKWNSSRIQKSMTSVNDDISYKKHEYTVDENGIRRESDGYVGIYEWSMIKNHEQNEDAIMLFISAFQAIIFPKSQIENLDDFLDHIKKYNV
jgi:YcxB-like protein